MGMRTALLVMLFVGIVACTYAIVLKGDHLGHDVRVMLVAVEILGGTILGSLIDLRRHKPGDHIVTKTLVVVSVALWLVVGCSAVLVIFCFLWFYGFFLLGSLVAITSVARLLAARGNLLAGAGIVGSLILASAFLAIAPPALPDAGIWTGVGLTDGILAVALLAALKCDGVTWAKRHTGKDGKAANAGL